MRGGIGNQFFQYMIGRMLANQTQSSLILDTTWYKKADREFVLDKLNTEYSIKIGNEQLVRTMLFLFKPKVIRSGGLVRPIKFKNGQNIILDGFWEDSTIYLPKLNVLLLKDLTLKNPSQIFLKYSSQIDKTNSISVHVRRGDFLTNVNTYIVQDKEYYIRGVEKILEETKMQNPSVTVFSDDVPWCMKNLSSFEKTRVSIFNDPEVSDLEQFFLMSIHRCNIISNSTFSWWAAFLNKNKDKIVVAPKRWVTNIVNNQGAVRDLILPAWKII